MLDFRSCEWARRFFYVVDRLFSGKRTNKRRFCNTWHAYVDDLTVRTGRVLDRALFTDAEYNARVKAAAGKEPKWKLQSTPEALAEQGFIPAGLGEDFKERSKSPSRRATGASQAGSLPPLRR